MADELYAIRRFHSDRRWGLISLMGIVVKASTPKLIFSFPGFSPVKHS